MACPLCNPSVTVTRYHDMGTIGTALGGIAQTPVSPAQTGLVLGSAAAAWSLRPSLLPRDEQTQAGVSVGSFALGYGAGVGLNRVLNKLTHVVTPRASLEAISVARLGVVGIGVGLGVMALPNKVVEDLPFSNTIESAGRVMMVTGLGSVGAQAHTYALDRLTHTRGQRGLLNAALIGGELAALGIFLEKRRSGFAESDASTPTQKVALAGALAVAGAYGIAKGQSALLSAVSAKTGVAGWKVRGATFGLLGAAALGLAASKILGKTGAPSHPLSVESAAPGAVGPNSDTKSQYDGLNDAGIRVLQGTLTADRINTVTGRNDALNPIRVAIGLASASSPEKRAELALKRMKETGAFDRENIFVAVAPGAGILDDRLPASVELYANGNVATVHIPYSDKASALSLNKIGDGAKTIDALLDGIAAENASRAAEGKPALRVLLYGNSLGAWSGQEVFQGGGVDAVTDRVDRVLWVGSPGPSGWRNEVLFPKNKQAVEGREKVLEFSSVDELQSMTEADRQQRQILLHTRDSDPVAKIDFDMLWRRPLYLQGEHRLDARVPNNAAYVPGVSFLQELGDIIQTSAIADDPDRQADGHTYRVDIVPDVAAAFFPTIDDAALSAQIEKAVSEQEHELHQLRKRQQSGT